MMDKLDQALAQFDDETLDITLGERISGLRQALMWNAFRTMQRVKKSGTKDPISEEEQYKQEECMKHFKIIETMYNSELKANKAAGISTEKMNSQMLQKIKDMKSSLGSIITNIPT